MRTNDSKRWWLALATATLLAPFSQAAISDDDPIWKGLSWYSSFNGETSGYPAEKPAENAGSWGMSASPATISVSGGDNKAILVGTGWTDRQTVLSGDDAAFTIVFRGQLGDVATGLFFAFGSKKEALSGGLAFRRGTDPGTFVVTTGKDTTARLQTTLDPADDWAWHTYALTYDSAQETSLTLYVDGEQVATGVPSGTVIDAPFQWGTRHGNPMAGEAKGNGAIDAMGVWKRVLTQTEIQALVADWYTETTVAVSFTALPEGYMPPPVRALPLELTGNTGLEGMRAAKQTVNGRAATVANITGGTGVYSIYGISDSGSGDRSTINHDVWLKVSGGAFNQVVGGKDNDWKGNHANGINGDLFTELAGAGTAAKCVIGAICGCGTGGDNAGALPFTGDTVVTVADGAKVSGAVVGSCSTQHSKVQQHDGNSTVRVYALQDVSVSGDALAGSGTAIIGASTVNYINSNHTSGATLSGNSTVEIVLTEGAGTFAKSIYGASRGRDGTTGDLSVQGDSTVRIDAPGIVFPNLVCAGGSGTTAGVDGTASLTLEAGIFTGSLVPCERGASVGASVLTLAPTGRLDLTRATIGDFGSIAIAPQGGTLVLGELRPTTAVCAADAKGVVALTPTQAEIMARTITLFAAESIPEGLTVEAEGLAPEQIALSLVDGKLCLTIDAAADLTWQTPAEGTDWDAGLEGFRAGDNVTFGANATTEAVTVPGDVRANAVTVAGDYALSGNGLLSVGELTVEAGGTLTLGEGAMRARRVYLMPAARAITGANSDGLALAEFGLTLAGQPVDLSKATISTTKAGAAQHPIANLIDGDLRSKWYWVTKATTFADCIITLDAGEGREFVFDGYRLAMADQSGRNPTTWYVVVDAIGGGQVFADYRQNTEEVATAWTPNAWLDETFDIQFGQGRMTLAAEGGVTVAGTLAGIGEIRGDVAFAEGSVLRASATGYPVIAGAVSGTVTLDVSALTLGDATVVPVLRAPEGLAITHTAGEDYEIIYGNGLYWFARKLTMPLTLTLSQASGWMGGNWVDATGTPVAPNQWGARPAETLEAVVAAAADGAMLSLDSPVAVGSLTVADTGHALTLAAMYDYTLTAQALTVAGDLATSSVVLAIPDGATIDGTLTYDHPSGTLALPNLNGSGTLVKTGGGTFNLANSVAVSPTVHVRAGTLALTSIEGVYEALPDIIVEGGATLTGAGCSSVKYNDASATFTFRDDAIFVFENGNSDGGTLAPHIAIANDGTKVANFRGSYYGSHTRFTGGIAGHGTLRFGGGHNNAFGVTGVIEDDDEGALALEIATNAAEITISGANTYSGGTTIARSFTTNNAEALGRGAVAVEEGGSLTVSGTLNVHAAYANAGTVKGAIRLCAGATLDAAAGTAVFDTVSTEDGATVTFTALPETMAAETRLAAWESGPADASGFSVPGWELAAREDGLYVVGPAAPAVTLPEAVAGEAEGVTFDAVAKAALTAAAEAAGLTEVLAVTGTANGRAMTTAEINAALSGLTGEGLVAADVDAGTLRVAYDFAVTALSLEGGTLAVTATVSGAEGKTVLLAEGVTAALIPVTLGETIVEGEPVAEATLAENAASVRLTLDATGAGTRLFKVRVLPPQSSSAE